MQISLSKRKVWRVALLLLLFGQMALSTRELSLTYDEPLHMAVGYTDLVTGDVSWHEIIGHPPLVILWNSLPLLLEPDMPDPRPFAATRDWPGLFAALAGPNAERLERITLLTRLPVMWLTLILAACVYRWAQEMGGGHAGLLALGLLAFDPAILAHGQLDTTDMGVTACGLMACYALARYTRRPGPRAYLLTGLALGAVLASKASGVFWVGAFGLIIGITWLIDPQTPRIGQKLKAVWPWALRLSGWLLIALFVLWAGYLFEVRPLEPGGVPLPAASHWAPLPRIGKVMSEGMTTFFAGQRIEGGHWAYFPVMLLIKTPIPQSLALLAFVVMSIRRGPGPRWSTIPLLVTPIAYLIVAMRSSLNIGHRHVLPMLPYLYVLMGQWAGCRATQVRPHRRLRLVLAGALGVWYVTGTLAVFPHYLAYFNESIGGPDNGYRYLADSSVDWGQGFKALKRTLQQRGLATVKLAVFTAIDPAFYDLEFTPIPPTAAEPITLTAQFNPEPGTYAISVLPLQGVWLLDPDTYAWFRQREPDAIVGHAIHIYTVERPVPDSLWVAQCTDAPPKDALAPGQVAAGFGYDSLRAVPFDCTQSWVYPASGSGWYVLPGEDDPTPWAQQQLEDTRLTYTQGEHWSHHALSLYFREQGPAPSPAHPLPSDLSGPLRFLGYSLDQQQDTLEIDTYWEVAALTGRPLSLMAHLARTDGGATVVKDGMGFAIEYWQAGDVIVQHHVFAIPDEAPPGSYTFYTGAYWLDTMERWTTPGGATEIALPQIAIPPAK